MTCPVCNKPSKPGYSSCQRCLDRRNINRKPPMPGLCICGKLSEPNRTRCKLCLSKCSHSSMRRRASNKLKNLCWCGRKPKLHHQLCQNCITKSVINKQKLTKQLKEEAFSIYGERCKCCNEKIFEFLTIDHINGNGSTHVRKNGSKITGMALYSWLKKNNYPNGFQTLCWNCNCAKGNRKECPHKQPNEISTDSKAAYQQRYRFKLKNKIFTNYGCKCTCCGEANSVFLTIDHRNNNGSEHRKQINQTSTTTTYRWIIKNNYPKEFQVLCWNCNITKHIYGKCPHQSI